MCILRKAQLPEQDHCRCGTSEALSEPLKGRKEQTKVPQLEAEVDSFMELLLLRLS